MGLILTILSLVLCYFSPVDVLPTLAPYRLQFIVLIPAVALSAVTFVMRGSRLHVPQSYILVGFWFSVVMSCLSKLWFGASAQAFATFGLMVCIYFLVSINAFSIPRIRFLAGTLSACAVILGLQGIHAYYTAGPESKLVIDRIEQGFGYYRRICAYGILSDPNDFAQFLLVGIALLGMFWIKGRKVINLAILTVPCAILVYAIYLTGSRGAT